VAFSPIGRVLSPFDGKFGAPRQPGLVPSAIGKIIFFSPWDHPDAFRGLEGFSHLWILFLAHQIPSDKEPSLTVRPPRLGGNARLGVFGTRSLFRPNPIGLSLVELRHIRVDNGRVSLEVSGLDLSNGTPVLDVKPYLPYVEAKPEARGGFADGPPAPVPVVLSPGAEASLSSIEARQPAFRSLLLETLAIDPRPAYLEEAAGRVFAFELQGIHIRFTTGPGGGLFVLDLTNES
jgi:tRNA-Thr(GGU) m(6)t(6)A37 methyltransferase TsaA